MALKSILPYLGDEKSIDRLKRIDKQLITVLAVIGMMFSKTIEGMISILIQLYPVVLWNIDFSQMFWYFTVGVVLVLLTIFGFDKFLNEAAEEVTDEIEEQTGEGD